ncbi:hypothetical protein MTR67_038683 [Solanum verrucosum]|uniref:Uncharacterized protein n=1 Tax=Solanum verrucosum TaxID=315347 RepID=A0AAF0UGB8_SOLVR|nr:hypothetical protein MTR67_038683 [Solanum verrucosum]
MVQDGNEKHKRANRRVDRRFRLMSPNDLSQHKFLKTINTR